MNKEHTTSQASNGPLGRLDRSELRGLLGDETTDMADWIVDNLDLVEDELVLYFDRDTIRREHPIGSMSADIVADTVDGRTVVFENQFGALDHAHFGKAIAYRTQLRADIIVWVAEHARSEYAQIVQKHNEDVDYDAYLLVLQAATPGCCGRPAGHFKAIAGPPGFMALAGRDERHRKYRGDQSLLALNALICRETARRASLEFAPRPGTPNYLAAPTGHPGADYEISVTRHSTSAACGSTAPPEATPSTSTSTAVDETSKKRSAPSSAGEEEINPWPQDHPRRHKSRWGQQQLWIKTAAGAARAAAKLHTTLQNRLQQAQNTAKAKPNNAGQTAAPPRPPRPAKPGSPGPPTRPKAACPPPGSRARPWARARRARSNIPPNPPSPDGGGRTDPSGHTLRPLRPPCGKGPPRLPPRPPRCRYTSL